MKDISLKLSSKLLGKDAHLFHFIANSLESLNFPYLIIGARARDLIFEGIYKIKCPRATLDTDLAIMLKSWAEFSEVKAKFIESGDFKITPGMEQRLFSSTFGIIDLVPFGPISTNNKISWPPEYSTVMNVIGFTDAYECSVSISIDDRFAIRCCSIVGLAILKFFSLADRRYITKDADDLAFIMMNYLKAGQHERIFHQDADFITSDFDYDCAGVQLLGRDISCATSTTCRDQLAQILASEIQCDKHISLAKSLSKLNLSFDDNFNRAIQLMTILLDELSSHTEQERCQI